MKNTISFTQKYFKMYCFFSLSIILVFSTVLPKIQKIYKQSLIFSTFSRFFSWIFEFSVIFTTITACWRSIRKTLKAMCCMLIILLWCGRGRRRYSMTRLFVTLNFVCKIHMKAPLPECFYLSDIVNKIKPNRVTCQSTIWSGTGDLSIELIG